MIKAVLDANILVSAFVVKVGKPAQILTASKAKHIVALTSEDILNEVTVTLLKPRITNRYNLTREKIEVFIKRVRAVSTVTPVHSTVTVVERDPKDNMVLACAVDGEAAYVVTGDKDLLELKEYQGIHIVTPAQFLAVL